MITSQDPEYQQAKAFKRGELSMQSPFRELAAWIHATYGVSVLNIVHEIVALIGHPRLEVILENSTDVERLGQLDNNHRPTERMEVGAKFLELLAEQRIQNLKTDGLFVVFSNFEKIAREEANGRITKAEIATLKQQLNNRHLWEISICFDCATFFFYTDDQLRGADRLKRPFIDAYFSVLKVHDEFGYFTRENVSVRFDSKENFDTNYASNWYYYYK